MKKYMATMLVAMLIVVKTASACLSCQDTFVSRHKTAITAGVAAVGFASALALLVDWQTQTISSEKLADLKELVLAQGAQAYKMLNIAQASHNFSQAAVLAGQSLGKAGVGLACFVQGAMRGGGAVGAKIGTVMGASMGAALALDAVIAPVTCAQAAVRDAAKKYRETLGLGVS